MKNLKRCLVVFLISVFCVCLSVGCSGNLGGEDSGNKDEATNIQLTKNFYKENGYFELSIPEIVSAKIDKSDYVYVEDSLLVKFGASVALSVNEFSNLNNFENASNLNFDSEEVLDEFYLNGQTMEISAIDGMTFCMNEDVLIESNFHEFDIIGTFVYCNYDELSIESVDISKTFEVSDGKLLARDNKLFFAYLKNGLSGNILNNNKITNDNCSVKNNKEDGENFVDFKFEIPLETKNFMVGLILKTSDGRFLLINKSDRFDGDSSDYIAMSCSNAEIGVRVGISKYFFI